MKYGDVTFGQMEAIINKLGGMAGVRRLLQSQVKLEIVKNVIDCEVAPFIPENWTVESHKQSDQLEWNSEKIQLHLDEGQQGGKVIAGNELRKKLAEQPTLNANVLDYLLAYPELIPEEWKGKLIFFWGTIYRNSGGSLCVRYLNWNGDRWSWHCCWLDDGFYSNYPAALLAS